MAGLILVLFAIALFMTGCEKKAQEKEEAQEASARQLVIQKQTQTEIAEKKIGQLCIRVCGRSLYVWRSGHLSARTYKYGKPLFETAISAAYSV